MDDDEIDREFDRISLRLWYELEQQYAAIRRIMEVFKDEDDD